MGDVIKKTIRPFRALRFLGRKPHTIRIPHQQHNDIEGDPLPTERYRGVHVNDWDLCISCGICAMVCPCDAIEMIELESEGGKKRPEVSYGRCCFCGFCEDSCPKKCIHLTSNHSMLDPDPRPFVFLPAANLEEFEEEYVVDTSKLCLAEEKDGKKVIVQGNPRLKKKEDQSSS